MIRKFTLFLFAVLLAATSAMGQKRPFRVEGLNCEISDLSLSELPSPTAKTKPQKNLKKAPRPRKVVSKQPEGEYRLYSRSGQAYLYSFPYVYETDVAGRVAEMVFADNGTVYLKDVISQYDCSTWIKGTIEENTIVFSFPQSVLVESGTTYYAMMMDLDPDQGTYIKSREQVLVMDYDPATGDIKPQADSPFKTNAKVIGLASQSGSWTGYADWNIELSPVNDKLVEAPMGMPTEPYSVTAEAFSGTLAFVGFQDDDIYVQGIYPNCPDAWVKGTIQGDKAVFANNQFLGIDESTKTLAYLTSAVIKPEKDPDTGETVGNVYFTDADITFSYDATNHILSNGSLFVVKAGTSYSNIYNKAVIKPFTEVAATPATPTALELNEEDFSSYVNGYGWGSIAFDMKTADVNGEFILPEKLSYILYTRVNGEERPLTIYGTDYQNIDDDQVLTEIPYTFGDEWDFYIRDITRYVYYYVVGPEAYGVQAVYRGGGEERRSEIAWVEATAYGAEVQPEAATPEYPDIDPADVGGDVTLTTLESGIKRSFFGDWNPNTYDVAIKVMGSEYVGTQIKDITITLPRVKDVSNVKVWLSSQLRLENGANVPDLVSVDIESPKTGTNTVTLPKPYIIPEGGVYVGYSLTISENTYTGTTMPIRVMELGSDWGFYIHTTKTFLKWMNIGEDANLTPVIEMTLTGSKVKENAVMPSFYTDDFVKVGDKVDCTVLYANHGSAGVKSIDVEFTINGEVIQKHIVPTVNIGATYGQTYQDKVTLPAFDAPGTYEIKVEVTKVNDVENQDSEPVTKGNVVIIGSEPKHRVLFEEYTGTWCGWCPRGFVAMEKLAKLYPDDYVCISYHNSDPMEIMYSFPSEVEGFPTAWMDRGLELDPYYGTGNSNFGVLETLKARASQFGTADLSLKAYMREDGKTIYVDGSMLFPFDDDEAKYAVEYIVIANGLTGPDGSNWDQSNYYSGDSSYGSDMTFFSKAGEKVPGLVFNDVAILMSEVGGIENSVPEKIQNNVPVYNNYTFDLTNAVNTSGVSLVQDPDQLYVAMLLINKKDGLVANSIKAKVVTPTVIESVNRSNGIVDSTEYYDLNGRRLPAMQKGMNIVRYHYTDGTTRMVKIAR